MTVQVLRTIRMIEWALAIVSLAVGVLAIGFLGLANYDAPDEGPTMARVLQSQFSVFTWCAMLFLGSAAVVYGLLRPRSKRAKTNGWLILALARIYQLVGSLLVVGFDLGDFISTLYLVLMFSILYLHNARVSRVKILEEEPRAGSG